MKNIDQKREKVVYRLENYKKEIDTVVYVQLDYYFYDLPVKLQSIIPNKILILLEGKEIPENYMKEFTNIIYAKTSEYEEIKRIVKTIIKDKDVKKVKIVSCDEHYFLMVAKLREEFKIPGYNVEKILNLINKSKMKEIVKKHGIPTHNFIVIEKSKIRDDLKKYVIELEQIINYPMFLKPTQYFGSINTFKIENEIELKKCLLNILNDKLEYELDEFVSNTIVSCDAIVIEGKMVFFRTRIILKSLSSFIKKGEVYATCIVPPHHQQYKKAFVLTKNVIEAFDGNFESRCINFEYIEQNQEKLLFMELNYRRPGCYACFIFDYNFKQGFNYEAIDIDLALGLEEISIYKDDFKSPYEFYAGSILYPGLKNSIVKNIKEIPKLLTSEIKTIFKIKKGEKMTKTKDVYNIPAIFILRNKSFDLLYKEIQRLSTWYPYEF